ncbi:hypothetical protein CHCC20335_2567 [Bacillus paralicheniformis]|nr:hypothetical protein CHCC20335_2567 [Bacillus paralicheniformis]
MYFNAYNKKKEKIQTPYNLQNAADGGGIPSNEPNIMI